MQESGGNMPDLDKSFFDFLGVLVEETIKK